MSKDRLVAFSDGVFAVIITILVLELRVPHGTDWQALKPLVPVFLCYVLSFVYIGIYWTNHHHLFHAVERVTGARVERIMGPRRPGDPPALVADPGRAQQMLQWKATRSLDEIVASAWNWMQRARVTA